MDVVLDGLEYKNIGQSRYSLVIKQANGKEVYPKCRKIFNKIYRLHGGPHIIQKFWEEASFTHKRVWKIKNENLSLRCFEKNGIRYAERISLYGT